MREYVLLYINGKPHRISGEAAFAPLSDYLRTGLQQTGTKVVCAEGDCGACTVLLGRPNADGGLAYQAVNSCIQYVYQLDGAHVVTIEGLKEAGRLNPVQERMVACHGAQCGYCTPGIVVALCGHFMDPATTETATRQDIRNVLTGNLCRCTGYDSIIQAGCSVDPLAVAKLPRLYPPETLLTDLKRCQAEPVRLTFEGRVFYKPVSVTEAVAFKREHPDAVLVSGGTDISVFCNKRDFEPAVLMGTAHLPGLEDIEHQDHQLVVGAKVSLSQLEAVVQESVPELHRLLHVFGSPQIKNAGTLAGNIANGSPIGDTLPFLFVMDAEVEVTGVEGARRINVNQLYTGYKRLALKPDEIITRILIPLPQPGETIKLYKVSRRRHLDISTFMAAFRMRRDGDAIQEIRIAYGGVGPTILRLPQTEAFLAGREFSEASFREAGPIARDEITPISDVRGTADFRYQLAANILSKFYHEVAQTSSEVPA